MKVLEMKGDVEMKEIYETIALYGVLCYYSMEMM